MGSIVSVKQRARKRTIAITALGAGIYKTPEQNNKENGRKDLGNGNKATEVSQFQKVSVNKNTEDFQKKRNASQDDGVYFEGNADSCECKKIDNYCKETTQIDSEELCFEIPQMSPRHEDISSDISKIQNGHQPCAKPVRNTEINRNENNNIDHSKRHVKEWFKAVSDSAESRSTTPVQVALGSWGNGVIGTDDQHLHQVGQVTSRGQHARVQSSVSLYSDFACVTSVQPQTPREVSHKSRCRGRGNGCVCRSCEADRRKAAVVIQSALRGHQARKELKHRRTSVIKIQRLFRKRVESFGKLNVVREANTRPEDRKPSSSRKPWREPPLSTPVLEPKICEKTKESFDMYQDDIIELKWRSQRLMEQAAMGEDSVPQKILLIASNVGKPEFLARVTLDCVQAIIYQFAEITLDEMLQNISLVLEDYRPGSKAKRIAFVCQGGPGFMYLCRGKVLTTAKLVKDKSLQQFIKGLGTYMSKIDPEDSKIHVIGNKILGNRNGVKLFEEVVKTMKPNRCSVESPLEMSANGSEMLEEYFDVPKYKMWKRIRHTKAW